VFRAYKEKGACKSQKMREKGLSEVEMKEINPQKNFAPQKKIQI
jgi:hypothetical protein